MKEAMAEMLEDREKSMERCRQLEQENHALMVGLCTADKKVEFYKARCKELEAEVSQTMERCEEVRTELLNNIQQHEERVTEYEKEAASLRARVEALEGAKARLKNRLKQTEEVVAVSMSIRPCFWCTHSPPYEL